MTKSKKLPKDGDLIEKLLSQTMTVDGKRMSAREAMLRALSNQSLAGDIDASIQLQKLRDQCGIKDDAKPAGYLIIPEPLSDEEYERRLYENQAPFREKNYGKGEY